MSSNLVATAVLLAALAAVACSVRPEPSSPCCQTVGHEPSDHGEIIYCSVRGY